MKAQPLATERPLKLISSTFGVFGGCTGGARPVHAYHPPVFWPPAAINPTARPKEKRRAPLGTRRQFFSQSQRGLSRQRALCLCNDRTESFGLVYSKIGENFTVYFDTCKVQAIDKA